MRHWVFHEGQLEQAIAASVKACGKESEESGAMIRRMVSNVRSFMYGPDALALMGPVHGQREWPGTFDLGAHIHRQREFSLRTFGPGARTKGVIDHIKKELREIEEEPTDLKEWVDVVLLALDGAWRAGYEPEAIAQAIRDKQAVNEARKWPDWRSAEQGQAIEHIRDR